MKRIIAILILALFIIGCQETAPPVNGGSNPPPQSNTANHGVQFVLGNDFQASLNEANKFKYIGFNTPFDPSVDAPEIVKVAYSNNVKGTPIVNIGFAQGVDVTKYAQQIVFVCKTYKPRYLGIGNEVNLLSGDSAAVVNDVYGKAKAECPNTQFFVVLQYESSGFNPSKYNTDMIGVTSYPFMRYSSPDQIPSDYYASLPKNVIFTEIGWKDANPDFIDVFLDRTNRVGMSSDIMMYGLLYDVQGKGAPWDSLGLISKDGLRKEAWTKWMST